MAGKKKDSVVSRRDFFRKSAVVGTGAGLAGQAPAQVRTGRIRFDQVADVVIVGAGASGLPAAIGHAVVVLLSEEAVRDRVTPDRGQNDGRRS